MTGLATDLTFAWSGCGVVPYQADLTPMHWHSRQFAITSRASRGWACVRQGTARWIVGISVALLACSVPGVGLLSVGELDAESEACEAPEHPDLYAPHAPKRREVSLGIITPSAVVQSGSLARLAVKPSPSGHRLSNGLCAPLRC